MWLPEEKTSIGIFESSSKSSIVRPNPPAAFSTFTIVKSIRCLSMRPSSASLRARRPGEPTTSPMKRMFIARAGHAPANGEGRRANAHAPAACPRLSPFAFRLSPGSPRVLNRTGLANDGDLDLTGILQLGLDLLGHVAREPERLVVVDPVGLDHDAQLPPRLDREGLLDSLEAVGDVLELLEPLDVGFEDLAAGPRPRRGQGVRPVDENGLERARLVVAVVALHRVDDLVGLAELLQDLAPELEVRALHLAVDRLADVVEEAGALGDLGVGAELGRHVRGEPGDLLGVLEDVLPVRGPVFEPPEQLDELGVEVRNRELERGGLSLVPDLLPELGADLLDDLLDPGRVDPAVHDEL